MVGAGGATEIGSFEKATMGVLQSLPFTGRDQLTTETFGSHLTGGAYKTPPLLHNAFTRRSMPSGEPCPRLRSKISA